jgi:hypothetical protein
MNYGTLSIFLEAEEMGVLSKDREVSLGVWSLQKPD